MSRLTVINSPPVDSIGEGFFYIKGGRPADSNFNELTFIDKNLEIIFPTLRKGLCADGCLEPASLLRSAHQSITPSTYQDR